MIALFVKQNLHINDQQNNDFESYHLSNKILSVAINYYQWQHYKTQILQR